MRPSSFHRLLGLFVGALMALANTISALAENDVAVGEDGRYSPADVLNLKNEGSRAEHDVWIVSGREPQCPERCAREASTRHEAIGI